jgi:glycosyltransferase involved in cell wall biosynthesis
VKLAVVVQRYGADISGGAELHARYIAERLARHAQVEVFTTRAADYITWRNELPAGEERVNGIVVRRFPVSRQRHIVEFGHRSRYVFGHPHSIGEELRWLNSQGPKSRALIRHISKVRSEFDFFLFFSFRYYQAYHGARAVPDKAILVPTAERDPVVGLGIFAPVFRGARAIMYNSHEERAMIDAVSGRRGPGVVVGVGSNVPDRPQAGRFRRKYGIHRPFAIYVGRIDVNKGCRELFEFFQQYAARTPRGLDLILVGSKHLDIPAHPRIKHLGFLPDEDKFDAIAAADVLVMPSPYESLSMVTLEAWALGRPVLANARCDVLRGQCARSNAGLFYSNVDEFCEGLFVLESTGPAAAVLGRNGRDYFRRNYTWPVVERKYLEMFERLKREPQTAPMDPLPGWMARRRRTLPPASQVVDALPSGASVR